MPEDRVDRRNFIKSAAVIGASSTVTTGAMSSRQSNARGNRVIGANNRINVGAIGVGLRGTYVTSQFAAIGEKSNVCRIVAVCDTYQKN